MLRNCKKSVKLEASPMELSPKQRMAKAMSLEQPDRIPVMCQMSFGHMLLQTGFSPVKLWFSAEHFAEALLRLRKLYAFDGILLSLHGHPPDWAKDADKIVSGKETAITWRNQDQTVFPPDDLPRHYPVKILAPPCLSDFDPETISESIQFIPVSQGLSFPIHPQHKYDVFDIIQKKAGKDYSIHGEVTSPFDYFLHLFGFKQGLVHLFQDASKCQKILQRFTEGIKKIASGQIEHHVDAIKISSPYAGSGFISPEFYQKFVLPFEEDIAKSIREQGIFVYTHTCGKISDRLEKMAESGVSGIECLDPPPLGDVRLSDAKRRIGHKVFIKGNIDPVNILLYGDKKTVEQDVKKRIEIGKPGGGYILSTACSIAPYTRKENIQLLSKAAKKFGLYDNE
jgi:hypothetical protein